MHGEANLRGEKNVECIGLLGNRRRGGAGSDWGTELKQHNVGTNGRSSRWGLPFCFVWEVYLRGKFQRNFITIPKLRWA